MGGATGAAGIGAVVVDAAKQIIAEHGVFIGSSTINLAEISALTLGAKMAARTQDPSTVAVTFYSDNAFAVAYARGNASDKKHLRDAGAAFRSVADHFQSWEVKKVPRMNKGIRRCETHCRKVLKSKGHSPTHRGTKAGRRRGESREFDWNPFGD